MKLLLSSSNLLLLANILTFNSTFAKSTDASLRQDFTGQLDISRSLDLPEAVTKKIDPSRPGAYFLVKSCESEESCGEGDLASSKLMIMPISAEVASELEPNGGPEDEVDPWQKDNRGAFEVNDKLDKSIVLPLAILYTKVTPSAVRSGISNFFSNLNYPGVIVNSFLQGKIAQGLDDVWRFFINSTLGVGGIFDPASSMGLENHEEDFGQTLGVWGADVGPYIVLPLLGPSSGRDVPGLIADMFTNLLTYIEGAAFLPLMVLDKIDKRAALIPASNIAEKAFSPYLFVRDAYLSRRVYLIYDGNPPFVEDDYYYDE